jgi:HTH-type transcriptional regulator, competence development regulator
MTNTSPLTPSERGLLGEYLWDLRQAAGMSLREVEQTSGEQVSNAYLSQLETGKIPKPSPAILHELALVYEARLPKKSPITCSYEHMMELAGHILPASTDHKKRGSRLPTFARESLTPDEERDLLKYLAFLRMRNKSDK